MYIHTEITYTHIDHTHKLYTYIYIYIYMCVYVCIFIHTFFLHITSLVIECYTGKGYLLT